MCARASVHWGVPVCVRSGRGAAEQAGEKPVVLTDLRARMQGAQGTQSPAGDSKLQRRERKAHDSGDLPVRRAGKHRDEKAPVLRRGRPFSKADALCAVALSSLWSDATAATGQEKYDGDRHAGCEDLSGVGVQAGTLHWQEAFRRRVPASPPVSGASGSARRPARLAAGLSRPGPSVPRASASGP